MWYGTEVFHLHLFSAAPAGDVESFGRRMGRKMQPWLLLLVAIVSEVGGTTSMKLSDGFSRLGPSLVMVVLYCVSIVFLTYALKYLDVGVAYALWSGLGTALVAGVGFVYFGESFTVAKIASLSLIVAGVIGLNLSGGVH